VTAKYIVQHVGMDIIYNQIKHVCKDVININIKTNGTIVATIAALIVAIARVRMIHLVLIVGA
jgi:hypothetical protein